MGGRGRGRRPARRLERPYRPPFPAPGPAGARPPPPRRAAPPRPVGDARVAEPTPSGRGRGRLPASPRRGAAAARRRPGVRPPLVQSATPESQNRLRRGEVEVAFLLRPVADPRLAVETVLRYRHVAAYPRTRDRGRTDPAPVDPG